jgi:iron complex transport system ATP-binding protein
VTGVLLTATDISFAYGDRVALRGVSVSLAAGEVVAVVGPNGSGKSTLIRALLGLHEIKRGAIEWEGKPIRAFPRRELARRVAYLPQNPSGDPDQTVADTLRLGRAPYLRSFGIESSDDGHAVIDVAGRLQLDDVLSRPLGELSGGQRQRVFIGRCLVQEPVALLLDEPNTFLDLRHQLDLLRLLRNLARERNIGVLMASHDLNLVGTFADRMMVLDDGAVVAQGSAMDVFRDIALGRAFGVQLEVWERGAGRAPFLFPRID